MSTSLFRRRPVSVAPAADPVGLRRTLGHVDPDNWMPFAPNGWDGIVTGAALIFFTYIGFDAVATTAEEARNPQCDLPIGIIASLLVCTVLYVLVTIVLTGVVPVSALANAETVAAVLRAVGEERMAALLSAGAVISMASVLLVLQLGQTRIFFAMSRAPVPLTSAELR